ncbi:MAG: hypothetical protein ACHP9Z_12245 [Streptosporangiales bacterium]
MVAVIIIAVLIKSYRGVLRPLAAEFGPGAAVATLDSRRGPGPLRQAQRDPARRR